MNWKSELRKFRRFLAFAILSEATLVGLVALSVRSVGDWSWRTFSVGLGIAGAAALLLGMYSLIGGGESFQSLSRTLKITGQDSAPPKTGRKKQDFTFLLLMVFAGSVAIGAGQYLQRLF